jgi:hypothetical protein
MVHAHCMLDTWGYKSTRGLCNTALIAFPVQQWLRERALVLRYTYIADLVFVMRNREWLYDSSGGCLSACLR